MTTPLFSLTGKVAFVTGAGSGIGEATAMALARAGAFVYPADLHLDAVTRVSREIASAGGSAHAVALDVRSEGSCAEAFATVFERHGRLDVLVNNAGVGHVGTIQGTAGADLDRLYAVNVRGVFNVSKAFIGVMRTQRQGTIINIASIGGLVGIKDRLAYCTTKFAVVGLTKSMALDHAADGVRVNCACPGRVETPFVAARLREYDDPEAAYREMTSSQALGRMARPDEIAAAVVYLSSDEAAFMTGSALVIDGGWVSGK